MAENASAISFGERAWEAIAPIRKEIDDLSLLAGLSDGTLDKKIFQHYIQQDAIYLKEYARALAIVASKADDNDQMANFLGAAQVALSVEQHLHSGFLSAFGLSPEDIAGAAPSPSCFAYTNFVMSVVQSSSYAVGLCAILPCFWIYWKVGEAIKAKPSVDGNPYQAWIDTYGDPQFEESTKKVIQLTNEAAARASEAEQEKMLEVFTYASKYEWMFWQSAWELEAWQV